MHVVPVNLYRVLVEIFDFTLNSVFIALSLYRSAPSLQTRWGNMSLIWMAKFIHGGWILILVATKCGKVAACTCKPAFVVFSDTDEEPIVVSILSNNNLRIIAPNSELLIHLYHSSGLIQWKTGLSACLHLFTLLSLEATHHFHLSGNLNWFDIPTVLSLKSIYRNYYIYNTPTFDFSVYTVHVWFMCSLASLTGSMHFWFVLTSTFMYTYTIPYRGDLRSQRSWLSYRTKGGYRHPGELKYHSGNISAYH